MNKVTKDHVLNVIELGGSWKGFVTSGDYTSEEINKSLKSPSKYSNIEMLNRAIDSALRYSENRKDPEVVFWEV